MPKLKQKMCSNCTVSGCGFEVHIGVLVHCPKKLRATVQQKREKVDKNADRIKSFREHF